MANPKISIVQKAKFGLLLLPLAWLVVTTWVLISEDIPRFNSLDSQEAITQPSFSPIVSLIFVVAGTLWIVVNILRAVRNHQAISSVQKSGLALFLGSSLMQIENYFHVWPFLFYLGLLLVDVAATIMIVTLLQGKPFGAVTLYHKDVQIKKGI
jgi:hypothetical protein